MKVFKFGGASLKDVSGFKNVCDILKQFEKEKLVVVVSAVGKTTNALEKVVESYMSRDGASESLLGNIKETHIALCTELGIKDEHSLSELLDCFTDAEWKIEEEPIDSIEYVYDQIVSVGELASGRLVYSYLRSQGLNAAYLDVRDILLTDEVYREAKVDWEETQRRVKATVPKLLEKYDLVITQGFIGTTKDNNTTTLGREGSDYTAAILSYCLDAESMHIWKDVPGVLTGDPKIFENVQKIDKLSYREAIEMTYFGAKVIHPKTIKPLQNKNIPLYVRPFAQPSDTGTLVTMDKDFTYPPIVVVESNQVLVHIGVKDFSFVAENHLSKIFSILASLRVKVNAMRNSAISFSLCFTDEVNKLRDLIEALKDDFLIEVERGLELITIRHSSESIKAEMRRDKIILFEETMGSTLQMVVKDVPIIKRKLQT